MKKHLIIALVSILFIHQADAQEDLTFYHLGATTPQSSIRNASFTPDAKFYISLPGLSGIK